MILYLLTSLVALLFSLVGYYFHTQSKIESSHKTSGPRAISEWVLNRNRTGLLIGIIVVAIVAFVEALVPEFAYSMQDLQARLNYGLPEWAIFLFQGGSVSWALYSSLLIGFAAGQTSGTVAACRRYARTNNFGFSEVV